MKTSICLICIVIMLDINVNLTFGQSLSPVTISSAGGSFTNTAFSLSWTSGEPAYTSLSFSALTVKQGIQQPYKLFKIKMRVFIEGYYIGGSKMVSAIFPGTNSIFCDTVFIEIKKPTFPYEIILRDSAILSTEGYVTFRTNKNSYTENYYIVLSHRNTLDTWTSSPLLIQNDSIVDFTGNASAVFGNNVKSSLDGRSLIISGDVNKDGSIDTIDLIEMEFSVQNFLLGYFPWDLNGDCIVETADYSLIENNLGRGVMRP